MNSIDNNIKTYCSIFNIEKEIYFIKEEPILFKNEQFCVSSKKKEHERKKRALR